MSYRTFCILRGITDILGILVAILMLVYLLSTRAEAQFPPREPYPWWTQMPTAPAISQEQTLAQAVYTAHKRNVVVQYRNSEGRGYGSGVIVETGRVLTVKHLNRPQGELMVFDKPARVLKECETADLLLLEVETPKMGKISVNGKIHLGELVFYVGNPEEHRGFTSFGRVVFAEENRIHTDTIAAFGFSGSGLYNFQGELVGLQSQIEFFEEVGAKVALAVAGSEIKKFLNGGCK